MIKIVLVIFLEKVVAKVTIYDVISIMRSYEQCSEKQYISKFGHIPTPLEIENLDDVTSQQRNNP